MKEEIIIDGVNVAGCKYLNKVVNEEPYCNIDEEHLYTCSSDENCYFKQLKRLEQENEELTHHGDEKSLEITKLAMENCKLEKENKQMKSALEEIREIIKSLNKDICNNCGWHNTDNCQPNGYVCHDLIEIKNKINEVLK